MQDSKKALSIYFKAEPFLNRHTARTRQRANNQRLTVSNVVVINTIIAVISTDRWLIEGKSTANVKLDVSGSPDIRVWVDADAQDIQWFLKEDFTHFLTQAACTHDRITFPSPSFSLEIFMPPPHLPTKIFLLIRTSTVWPDRPKSEFNKELSVCWLMGDGPRGGWLTVRRSIKQSTSL